MPIGHKVFTIGYQGRSVADLCEALVEAGVDQLVDVRARAWSNRPEYRKTVLGEALGEHGITYIHCKEAGNPYRPVKGEERRWDECRDLYRKHLRENPSVVSAVSELVLERTSALFCYEAERTACHRGELVKAMRRKRVKFTLVDL